MIKIRSEKSCKTAIELIHSMMEDLDITPQHSADTTRSASTGIQLLTMLILTVLDWLI